MPLSKLFMRIMNYPCEQSLYFKHGSDDKEFRVRVRPSDKKPDLFLVDIYAGARLGHGEVIPWVKHGRAISLRLVHRRVITELFTPKIAEGYTDNPVGYPGTHSGMAFDNQLSFQQTKFNAWMTQSKPTPEWPEHTTGSNEIPLYGPPSFVRPDHISSDFVSIGFGLPTKFRPASLPLPFWAMLVNPTGAAHHSQAWTERCAKEYFAQHATDASFVLMKGRPADIIPMLHLSGLNDSSFNKQRANGSAYVVWKVDDNQILVGGFDNGGNMVAMTSVSNVARKLEDEYPVSHEIQARFACTGFHFEHLEVNNTFDSNSIATAIKKIASFQRYEKLSKYVVPTPPSTSQPYKF